MPKQTKTLVIVAVVIVAAYLGYRWYENRKNAGTTNSPTGALGTNLNSVAPELVGGSSGPSVGPALSTPINITLNENVAPPPVDQGGPMIPANNQTAGALDRQGMSAADQGMQDNSPADDSDAEEAGAEGAPTGPMTEPPKSTIPGGINPGGPRRPPAKRPNPGGPMKRPKPIVKGKAPAKK